MRGSYNRSGANRSSEDELFRAEQAEVDTLVPWLDALTRRGRISGRTLERWGVRLEAVAR